MIVFHKNRKLNF